MHPSTRSSAWRLSFINSTHNSKYKLMENSCERTKLNLKAKIPDIEKTLELVRVLQEKQVGAMGSGMATSR